MREKHELEHGVICEKCLDIVTKENYTRIRFAKPIVEDTTGKEKIVSRMNLCNSCYEEYKKVTAMFVGREFIEYENNSSKIEKLNQLRNELINGERQESESLNFKR